MSKDAQISFVIGPAEYHIREMVSADTAAFQKIYEKLKAHGQYYAYLWKSEKDENGIIDCQGVGKRFVAEAVRENLEVPQTVYRFAISDAGGNVIGYVIVLTQSDHDGDQKLKSGCEIGYFISPEYQGKGIATRAISTLINVISEKVALDSIWGLAHPDNAASIRVFEKLGMHYVRKTKSPEDKKYPDRLLYIKELA
jgi:RimJ/RimL family protein N-acetyltransferase